MVAVAVRRLGQRDRAQHGDAGFQVFRVARHPRHVQEGIDRIHAAPVDEIAGRAGQRAVPGGIGRVMNLHGQRAMNDLLSVGLHNAPQQVNPTFAVRLENRLISPL
jgi:hypothetical protein